MTKKQAIERSIELWTWLAETGKDKWQWPEWERYGNVSSDCFLCEYTERRSTSCSASCPYWRKFGGCCTGVAPYYKMWNTTETEEDLKKYASLFLEQLKQLLEKS